VIKKRQRDYATVAVSVDQNDIRLGECPQTKVSLTHNNKQKSYDSKSKNVPAWYNRIGPGQYESVDLSKISQRDPNGKSVKINPIMIYSYGVATKKMGNQTSAHKQYNSTQMANNVFTHQLPKHRFTDFSQAQLNIDLLERRRKRHLGKHKTDEDIELAAVASSMGNIKKYARLDYLKPPEK